MKLSACLIFWLLLGLSLDLSAQAAGGAWERSRLIVGASSDTLGSALALGPDFDGDGFPEVAVGNVEYRNLQFHSVGAVQLVSGKSGQTYWLYEPPYLGTSGSAGQTLSFVPDLNGDGIADIISGSEHTLAGLGQVIVLSGGNGTLIRQHDGVTGGVSMSVERLGWQVLGIQDINNDGYGDYLLSAPLADRPLWNMEIVGRVECRSGLSGQLLWQTYGLDEYGLLGMAMCLGPDLNADSVADILVSATSAEVGGVQMGTVYGLDVLTGQIIRTYIPPVLASPQHFGSSLATIPDLDGDLMADFVVGAPTTTIGSMTYAGRVYAISSATGAVLWTRDGAFAGGSFGWDVYSVGDLNQDGVREVVVHEPYVPSESLHVLSGQDGSNLWQFAAESHAVTFGEAVVSFDRNHDGLDELLVGEAGGVTPGGPNVSGLVHVLSFDPYLHKRTTSLSASSASPLRLELDFPATEAGKPFAVLASAAGNSTTTLHGLDIPLVVDAYFQSTVQAPPSSFRGILGPQGNAIVNIVVPPSRVAPLVGSTLYFAAVTAGGGQARLSSVAVPISIVP